MRGRSLTNRARYAGGALALVALAACGKYSSYGPAGDAGPDAAMDAGADVTGELAVEAGPDAMDVAPADAMDAMDVAVMDATDAGPEPAPEAGPEPTPEAGREAGPEAGPDVVDAAPPPEVDLVSVNAAGTAAGAGRSSSGFHSLSDDGRYVVFVSTAPDLVTPAVTFPTGPVSLVYLRDLRTRTTTLLSGRPGMTNTAPNGDSASAAISGDGNVVAFVSRSTNLVAGLSGTTTQLRLYRWRRSTGTVDLVSVERDGMTPISFDEGGAPILSRDGRYLHFNSRTRFDLPGPRPGGEFVALAVDLDAPVSTRTFELVSRSTTGAAPISGPSFCTEGDNPGGGANTGASDISSDGRFAVASTNAQGLVPGDSDGCADAYIFERGTNNTRRVNARVSGVLSSARAFTIDDAGRRTLAETKAPLSLADGDAFQDVYYGPVDGSAWERVSAPRMGGMNDGDSGFGRVDASGTRVLFWSRSSALVAGDTNRGVDLFLRDLATNTTTRVSMNADGSQFVPSCMPSGDSCLHELYGAELARDGSLASFYTASPIAGAMDTNDGEDVYVRRIYDPSLQLVSATPAGLAGDAPSKIGWWSVSADGRYVVFLSQASNLTATALPFPGGTIPRTFHAYVRDTVTATTTLVSVPNSPSAVLDADVSEVSISADGSTVYFITGASNLLSGDGMPDPGTVRVYRWRRGTTDAPEAVVRNGPTALSLRDAGNAIPSSDGRYLALTTRSLLGTLAVSGVQNAYLIDTQATPRTYTRMSVGTSGGDPSAPLSGTCGSGEPEGGGADAAGVDLSPNGQFVVINSAARDLTTDGNPADSCSDAFVYDRVAGTLRRVQARANPTDDAVRGRWISADGMRIALQTRRPLAAGDLPSAMDPYEDVVLGPVAGGGPSAWTLVSRPMFPGADGSSYNARVDLAQRRVLYVSRAANLVAGDTNFAADLFVYDTALGTNTRVTLDERGAQLDYRCTNADTCGHRDMFGELSADGTAVVFGTPAAASSRDRNAFGDVYLRRIP